MQLAPRPDPSLHVNLGAAYLGKKMLPEARTCFERAVALAPRSQRARWFLARTLRDMGAFERALSEFERAYRLDPESPEGHGAADERHALAATLGSTSAGGVQESTSRGTGPETVDAVRHPRAQE